jgi:putative ABC transport system permease protein
MLKNILIAFALALENIRTHFFHTVLSVLGIVIGVTALVAILSLIDGMEKYAHHQISTTTSLKAITISTERYKRTDNVWIKKDTFSFITYPDFIKLKTNFANEANSFIYTRQSGEVLANNQKIGAYIIGASASLPSNVKLAYGNLLSEADIAQKQPYTLINYLLATRMTKVDSLADLVGRKLLYKEKEFTIKGILDEKSDNAAEIVIPITFIPDQELTDNPPSCVIEATNVENVTGLKTKIEDRLKKLYPATFSGFSINTNEFRLKQVEQGFLFFRIVMGMIVGLSIVVGGIGVMNVLLISVTERTVEIGIRKAMGAKRKDILLQFLSESVTISAFGSILGLILGIASTFAIVPIIKAFVPVPFEASYTWNTLLIIATIAVLIGIVFGTYPAMRASRLDPVEAIRRE